MRTRPFIALSVAALAALSLVGCSSQSEPEASASATNTAAPDLCTARVASGDASDAVKVSGKVGEQAKVSFDKPLEITALQSTVVSKGSGDKIASGDFIKFALTEYNAETGKKNGAIGQGDGTLLPQQVSASSTLGQVLGCATVGTRVVATMPGDEDYPATVDVLDVLGVVPTAAWGDPQPPVDGMPKVTLADDGTPSITIPDTDAPKDLEMADLKKGDGAKVAAGDDVLTQYVGVKWSDGKQFDSSWKRGVPAQFNTENVYKGFKKALVGHTVGSQVLVVMPPSMGDTSGDLKGETLVFVVDILGVQKGA